MENEQDTELEAQEPEIQPEPEPEPSQDEIYKSLLLEFLGFYPEFKSLFFKIEKVEKKEDNETPDNGNTENIGGDTENPSDSENGNTETQDLDLPESENKDITDLPNEPSEPTETETPTFEYEEVEVFNEVAFYNWVSVFRRVSCLYPEFKNVKDCKKIPLFALVAHYFVYQGFASSIGILSQKGLVASSSVGDVSVSYQSSPYANKGNDFSYFLSLTPYGMEYLAWLQRQAGLLYVN